MRPPKSRIFGQLHQRWAFESLAPCFQRYCCSAQHPAGAHLHGHQVGFCDEDIPKLHAWDFSEISTWQLALLDSADKACALDGRNRLAVPREAAHFVSGLRDVNAGGPGIHIVVAINTNMSCLSTCTGLCKIMLVMSALLNAVAPGMHSSIPVLAWVTWAVLQESGCMKPNRPENIYY